MCSPIQQRSHIDIKATVQAHHAINPSLLGAHALSGYDSVPTLFGIGKGTVLKKHVAAPDSLTNLGSLDAPLPDVVDQATKFMGTCYGSKVNGMTTSDIRYQVWATKFGNTATPAPKIQTLPPLTESFTENVKKADLQMCTWMAALLPDPPSADSLEYGCVKHELSKSLIPRTIPDSMKLALDEIMSLIKCNCEGANQCRNMQCSCNRLNRLPCTLFCKCNADNECLNKLTKTVPMRREDDN